MSGDAELTNASSRREFLLRAAAPVVAGCLACSAGIAEPDLSPAPYAEILPGEIRIRLDLVPAFADENSYIVIYEANVIAVHLAGNDYRAFTNICTHAGCGITLFLGGRFRCQCHGSEFDAEGTNVAGPALIPLKRYRVSHDSPALLTIHLEGAVS